MYQGCCRDLIGSCCLMRVIVLEHQGNTRNAEVHGDLMMVMEGRKILIDNGMVHYV